LAPVAAVPAAQAALVVVAVAPAAQVVQAAQVVPAVAAVAVVLAVAAVAAVAVVAAVATNTTKEIIMKTLRIVLPMILLLSLSLIAFARGPGGGGGGGGNNGTAGDVSRTTLDAAETVHLLFMRAEEKLAHDVYEALGSEFPEYAIFGNIMNSETNHVETMIEKIEQFELMDPNILDEPGEFNAANFGAYFTEKYTALTNVDADPEIPPLLQALLNGALIEELDMHDIIYCPEVIVDAVGDITDQYGCGMEYTDAKALIRSYGNLLDGSESHLRAFVRVIETNFSALDYPDFFTEDGLYKAQYLSQEEVDEILGR
jgi:hypothetical protein